MDLCQNLDIFRESISILQISYYSYAQLRPSADWIPASEIELG